MTRHGDEAREKWVRIMGRRVLAHIWLKSFGIPGFIGLFFVAYFLLLYNPLFPITVMPFTALDRWIGFHPWALVAYLSLWIYVSLPPALIGDKRELIFYLWACIGLSLAGMLIFLFWPTATPTPDIDWSRYPGFQFLQSVGLARNACPSLHAAFAVFSGFWLARQLRELRAPLGLHIVNILWCLAILYSTIATRQHVALDIYAGSALGTVAFILHRQFLQRLSPATWCRSGTGGAIPELQRHSSIREKAPIIRER
ncbi:MAG: phosphatase PAP2 family protein [Gammaproteobacteria bacterium]